MSVLPHHGGSFLQRRLTKLYTDTKASCESVTTASNAVDNPELIAVHREFKTQRDRLLAWGLNWSDANAAQPNDIDESLIKAGIDDVVESVMSTIQDKLSEAERLQNKGASDLPPKGGKADSPAGDALGGFSNKTTWTREEIDRSKTLLTELTGYIDVLYDVSGSRRNMTASAHPLGRTRSYPSPQVGSPGGDTGREKSRDFKAYHGASFDSARKHQSPQSSMSKEALGYSSFSNLHDFTQSPVFEQPKLEKAFHKAASVETKSYLIDRSALQLTGASHDNNPPPYEMVAASTNSRVLGRMKTSALPFRHKITESTVSILVEYTPMVVDSSANPPSPEDARLENVHQTLDQLVQNARVSHLALLNFLGYYIDLPNARYAFVYQMPVDYFPFLQNPTDLLNDLKPKPLVSLLQMGEDYPVPSLETRFRLAYDLLMAVLQLRSQNLVHGNINSSNVLIFPGLNSNQNEVGLTENLRRPYLTSFAQFSGNNPTPEPLSSNMYRHPDDKRMVKDDAAWSYDLYSLGLVLMEIGLWTPISRLWKLKYDNSMFKQRVESMYLKKLGPKCGSAYIHVVQLCLDAPNFHLSTQPFDDFNLRIPQTFHYPVLDLSAPEGTFSFSMNFIYTLCKIAWSCCRIDIFSAPAAEELDDCLPLALVPGSEVDAAKQVTREYEGPQQVTRFPQALAAAPAPEMKLMKVGLEERRPKKRTFKKLTTVEIPQHHLDEWNFKMLPKLRKLLQKILKDSSESCGVTLMMAGDGLENARTTIFVTCASVKKVRAGLKRYFPLEDKEDWDLVVLRGDIERSKVPRKKRRRPARTGPQSTLEAPPPPQDPNPCFQPRPLCGASMGAFVNEEHFPPVSYGGAILVDGVPYGMTVHHMLEAPSDQEDSEDLHEALEEMPLRSAGNWSRDMTAQSAQPMYAWGDDVSSQHSLEFEVSDDEDGDDYYDDFALSEGYSSDEGEDDFGYDDDDDRASIGDTAGIEPEEEPPIWVTQPAIDDVREDFFPCPDDRDDEHLASHTFGCVHASSGVRRWTRQGIKHEIDWALIKIDEQRLDPRNIVYDKPSASSLAQVRRRPGEPMPPLQRNPILLNGIAPFEELGGLNVHCCGRTSGLQKGQISKALTMVKLHGRHTFSTSFGVDGNFGVPGDSGAWVFEKSTGRVCGAVLAWSETLRIAYIAPMEILLEDIARTLHATNVTLPGHPNESVAYPIPARYLGPPPLPDQLHVNFNQQMNLNDQNVGAVNTSRGLENPYPHNLPPILTPGPGRNLERQLA